jgi:hypothetical protein
MPRNLRSMSVKLAQMMALAWAMGCTLQVDHVGSNCLSVAECFLGEHCRLEGDGGQCVVDSLSTDSLISQDMMVATGQDAATVDASVDSAFIPRPLASWTFDTKLSAPLASSDTMAQPLEFDLVGSAWLGSKGLSFGSDTGIFGTPASAFLQVPQAQLFDPIVASSTIAIRMWVWSTQMDQDGPARLFTWSSNINRRNITIGQLPEGTCTARLRLDNGLTTDNGVFPEGGDLLVNTSLRLGDNVGFQQIILQYAPTMGLELWVDDEMTQLPTLFNEMPGGFSDWNPSYNISLGNEMTDGQPSPASEEEQRPWSGRIWMLEIFDQPLSPDQIRALQLVEPV